MHNATIPPNGVYRYLTYALVPVLWSTFIFAAWFVTTHELPWHAQLAMVLNAGIDWVAYLPALWFAVMNPRLLDAVGRDPNRINFDPAQRDALCKRYQLT